MFVRDLVLFVAIPMLRLYVGVSVCVGCVCWNADGITGDRKCLMALQLDTYTRFCACANIRVHRMEGTPSDRQRLRSVALLEDLHKIGVGLSPTNPPGTGGSTSPDLMQRQVSGVPRRVRLNKSMCSHPNPALKCARERI